MYSAYFIIEVSDQSILPNAMSITTDNKKNFFSIKLLNKKDGFKKIRYHLSLLANLKYRCYEENFRIIFYFDFVSM